jgi:hypothetical protein
MPLICSEVPEAKDEEGAVAFFAAHTALREQLDALQKVHPTRAAV